MDAHAVKAESKLESKSKPQYFFKKEEDLRDAIRRILAEQLTRAVQVLSRPEGGSDSAVHEARRSLKRARSLLRLVKVAIPNTYARENRRLRDVGRSLSELRDSQALIQTLEDLQERWSKEHRAESGQRAAFAEAHEFLQSRGEQIAAGMNEGGLENAIAQLKAAIAHVDKLTYAKVNFPRIAKSLRKSVKRGIEAFRAAEDDPEPERFHEFRKRAKDLRYQLSLLSELRPDLQKYSESAKELEQMLGDDHNLAVLTELLKEAQTSSGGEIHSLQRQIVGRQSALRDKARSIATHLYGGKRKAWKHRLNATALEP